MKKIILALLMTMILITTSACGTESNSDSSASTATTSDSSVSTATTSDASASTDTAKEGWNKIGKVATVDDIQYTVNAVKFTDRFCFIDIAAKNLSKEPGVISSIISFSLSDADGKKYSISFSGLMAMEKENLVQVDGNIAASAEIKNGGLAYEVPESTKGLTLTIKGLLSGEEKIELN